MAGESAPGAKSSAITRRSCWRGTPDSAGAALLDVPANSLGLLLFTATACSLVFLVRCQRSAFPKRTKSPRITLARVISPRRHHTDREESQVRRGAGREA